jgi:hypothetical protein
MSPSLPLCKNPNKEFSTDLLKDELFLHLTTNAKATYLALLTKCDNGIIDFDLRELIDSDLTDWTLKLAMMELAVAKLIAQYEGILYLPRYNDHVKEVENVKS